MEMWQYLIFVVACFALNMTPGPNNLLALNNARCYGFRLALIAGGGRLLAFSVMITLAASGLAAVLYASETLFLAIKVAGASYLFYLAWQLWRADAIKLEQKQMIQGKWHLVRQEFALAAGNPKAILIFTAFLPQFIDLTADVNQQFLLLGSTFLVLELGAIAIYACFGLYLKHWFNKAKTARRFNKACAGFLSFSGANLLFSKQ